ncbi:hypothetical protein LUW76_21895 [Actinomadura madurae]|nr:hypothetical protein [Actinomadura madurae]URM96781.1 hypothetical protein LUW76_21895 [Actinomadura madurae]
MALRNSRTVPSHTPATACLPRERRSPRAERSTMTSRRAGPRPRYWRRRPSHSSSPPATMTHSQLAASSEYSRPGTPRCRLRCSSSSQVVSGVSPDEVVSAPVTRPVYGSTYTVRCFSPSSGTDIATAVVACSSAGGMTVTTVPSGCAACAARTWPASGRGAPETLRTRNSSP